MELSDRRFTCSTRCKCLFGLPLDASVAFEHVVEAIHPDDRQQFRQAIEQALDPAGNGRFALEHRVLHPNGQQHWVRSTCLALFDGQHVAARRFQGITKDIAVTQPQHVREFEFLAETIPEIL
jgi:PAS domain-containing protein